MDGWMDGLMDDVKPRNLYYQQHLNQREGRKEEREKIGRKIQRTMILGPYHGTFSCSVVSELYLEIFEYSRNYVV
jgi:hypothetical protein